MFDDILTISDDGRNDWIERKDAEDANVGWRENGEALRRSQLRVASREWMAAKLKPNKFGDKLDLNHSGEIKSAPLSFAHLTHEMKVALLALLEEATGEKS